LLKVEWLGVFANFGDLLAENRRAGYRERRRVFGD
jgi:hypothetical protein